MRSVSACGSHLSRSLSAEPLHSDGAHDDFAVGDVMAVVVIRHPGGRGGGCPGGRGGPPSRHCADPLVPHQARFVPPDGVFVA